MTIMLTTVQHKAIAADGDVLVMAGAGTGKTHTLGAMHQAALPVSLAREILIVTSPKLRRLKCGSGFAPVRKGM
jgi:superfamily I DNA/RNA helicase